MQKLITFASYINSLNSGCQGLDYQNFRAGNASGARGEMASLCASVREQTEGVPYKTWRKSQRPRLVPLIGFFP